MDLSVELISGHGVVKEDQLMVEVITGEKVIHSLEIHHMKDKDGTLSTI